MNGFINIDKPSGITSYDVIRRLKPFLPRVKLGHLGTLDPMASGVLPIAVGYATRLIGYINDNTKEYQAEMLLGGVSDTQDSTGQISQISSEPVTRAQISAALERMVGEIKQIPPMYSAVHFQGRRLYELARQGTEVEVKPRLVTVNYIKLLDVANDNGHQAVRFMIGCSSGTYVRTICHDVGQQLGCGAYLNSLIRTRSGPFTLEKACKLDSLISNPEEITARLWPPDFPLQGIPRVEMEPAGVWAIINGAAVSWPGVENNGLYRIYDQNERLLAIARGQIKAAREMLQPEKVLTRG
ncbi:MAG: tRNA pseudouridine(55) synthase TruB [Syntrophomonadales bacterium]